MKLYAQQGDRNPTGLVLEPGDLLVAGVVFVVLGAVLMLTTYSLWFALLEGLGDGLALTGLVWAVRS